MKHNMIYMSPSGSTKKIINRISKALKDLDQTVSSFNMAEEEAGSVIDNVNDAGGVLWLASPVYVGHPLPLFIEMIREIDPVRIVCACAVATWGGVTSGLALMDFHKALQARGIPLAAAGLFPSVHSSMWGAQNPLCSSRPDEKDLSEAGRLTSIVVKKAGQAGTVAELTSQQIAYQGDKAAEDFSGKSLDTLRAMLPAKTADPEKCTQCGLCISECPVNALHYTPYPAADESCIFCNRCVRNCPEQAFPFDHEGTEKHLTHMSGIYNESRETILFI